MERELGSTSSVPNMKGVRYARLGRWRAVWKEKETTAEKMDEIHLRMEFCLNGLDATVLKGSSVNGLWD